MAAGSGLMVDAAQTKNFKTGVKTVAYDPSTPTSASASAIIYIAKWLRTTLGTGKTDYRTLKKMLEK